MPRFSNGQKFLQTICVNLPINAQVSRGSGLRDVFPLGVAQP